MYECGKLKKVIGNKILSQISLEQCESVCSKPTSVPLLPAPVPTALCVEIEFYVDNSWESKCNVEISV